MNKIAKQNKPAHVHMGVKGKFKLQVYGPHKELRREVEFPNLIVTSGLRALFDSLLSAANSSGAWHACRVGSGSSSPALGQTSLDSQVAVVLGAQSENNNIHVFNAGDPTDYHIDHEIVYQFAEGAAAGNLSEIGIGFSDATNTGDLFCRALILDGGGSPTTITVLSDEFLVVTWTFSRYPYVNGEVTGTVDGYSYRLNPVGANSFSWDGSDVRFNSVTSGVTFSNSPPMITTASMPDPFDITSSAATGTSVGTGYSQSNVNYNDTNHTVIKRLVFTPTEGNQLAPSGIKTLRVRSLWGSGNSGGSWAVEFTPAIDKNENRSLTIDFLLSWGNL